MVRSWSCSLFVLLFFFIFFYFFITPRSDPLIHNGKQQPEIIVRILFYFIFYHILYLRRVYIYLFRTSIREKLNNNWAIPCSTYKGVPRFNSFSWHLIRIISLRIIFLLCFWYTYRWYTRLII